MKDKFMLTLQQETNLIYVEKNKVLYGRYKEYYTYIQSVGGSALVINFPLKLNETFTINEINLVLSNLCKEYSNIKSATYSDYSVQIRYTYKTNRKVNSDNIVSILNTLVQEASSNCLNNCCPICGEHTEISPFVVNRNLTACCDNCKSQIKNGIAESQESIKQLKSNVITGTIGAFLGSLIGVGLWIVVGLAGYIAAICGLVLAICTIKGYQLFGGKLDKKGIFITIIITVFMVFVSQYLSLTLDIYNELNKHSNITIFKALEMVPKFLVMSKVGSDFYYNLGLGYIFTIMGSFSQFKNSYKQANFKFETEEY